MTPIEAFRALVMADPTLQQALAEAYDPAVFRPLAIECAASAGIALDRAALEDATRNDPLGLGRLDGAPQSGSHWPPLAWLPTHVTPIGGDLAIDWAHFAGAPLADPFYEESLRRAACLPFNLAFRYRTMVGDFVASAEHGASLEPDGFIFHMSRCGSTLAAQMFAALPDTIAISEPPPLEAVVQFAGTRNDIDPEWRVEALRAMVSALGRRRSGGERRYVIKLDSWHILALPLFRRSFPQVPCVFLYRDPVEVLVSQMRMRGIQTMPQLMPPGIYGMQPHEFTGVPGEDVCARVLGLFCRAAADHLAEGGLAVAYSELPEAAAMRIADHFGLTLDARDRAAMAAAAGRDAKRPGEAFAQDSASKQQEAGEAIRAAAARHMAEPCARLSASSPPAAA